MKTAATHLPPQSDQSAIESGAHPSATGRVAGSTQAGALSGNPGNHSPGPWHACARGK